MRRPGPRPEMAIRGRSQRAGRHRRPATPGDPGLGPRRGGPRGARRFRLLLPLLGLLVAAGAGWWLGDRAERPAPGGRLLPPAQGRDGAARAVVPPVAEGLPAPEAPGGAVDPGKDRQVAEAMRRARASTVTVIYETRTMRRVASGVILNDQGDILAIGIDPPADPNRPSIVVRDSKGARHPANWLGTDPETGLTLLHIDAPKLTPIRLAAGDPTLGEQIFLIGHPYGLEHSVNRGHVAGLKRQLSIRDQLVGGLIQIQAPLHPGDSGALLADLDGGWLGLVRGTLAAPDTNVGFAIPARDALWVADHLRRNGRVDRAYLGLRLVPDPEEDRQVAAADDSPDDRPSDRAGTIVAGVIAGTPAERLGLRPGDRIIRVDDRPVRVAGDLTDRLDRVDAGAELTLEYMRGATRLQGRVQAASRPNLAATPRDIPFLIAAPTPAPAPVDPSAAMSRPVPTLSPAGEVALRERLMQLERRVVALEQVARERRREPSP